MLLRPTAKAHRELHPGVQTLTLRQRSVAQGCLAPEDDVDPTLLHKSWKSDITEMPPHEDL